MMISTKGRYALRVMVDIAENQRDGYIPLKEIAHRQDISEKYLEAIVKGLVKERYLTGLRGKSGGYRLTRAPEDYTVGAILRITEGSPRGLPGAGTCGLPPHGGLPHPAHVAQAEHDDPGLFRRHHPGRPDGHGSGGERLRYLILKGSLCETASPDTGEVARSARGGALSPQATEGDTKELTTAKSQALSPHHPLRGSPLSEGAFFIGIPIPFFVSFDSFRLLFTGFYCFFVISYTIIKRKTVKFTARETGILNER